MKDMQTNSTIEESTTYYQMPQIQIVKQVAVFLFIIGIMMLSWSYTLDPYKDQDAMEKAMFDGPGEIKDSKIASKKYWAVRDEQLTYKYTFQDYGLTAIIVSTALLSFTFWFIVKRKRKLSEIKVPQKSWKLIILGLAASLLGTITYMASLVFDQLRGEFPPWADSLGIPLMYLPGLLIFYLIIVAIFSIIGVIGYNRRSSVFKILSNEYKPKWVWHILLGFPALLSCLMVTLSIFNGDFFDLIPSFMWALFFLCFYAGKQRRPENLNFSGPLNR